MVQEQNPLLAIRCIAYNQEKYIAETLKGFVSQKTTFPFIAIVHDDASNDKTPEIIKEYTAKFPKIIKPIYEIENQYSKKDGSLNKIMDEAIPASVKYIAYCEGDDVWVDPLKLQKQYNYLESHPDYGLCHTNYNVINESGVFIKIPKVTIYGDNEYLYRMIADGNCIATLTVVLRKSLYDICPKYYIGMNWAMEDKPTWLEIAALSKIGYIDEVTSSYRIVKGSASHGRDMRKVMQFATSGFELDNFYDKKYNLGVNRPKNEFYEYCLKEALRIGDKKVARELFTQSINDRSMNLRILFLFLCAILSFTRVFSIIRALKR